MLPTSFLPGERGGEGCGRGARTRREAESQWAGGEIERGSEGERWYDNQTDYA